MDYPQIMVKNYRVQQRVNRWTRHANYILSGCDWVYYTPRWDALCPAHFTVDTDELAPVPDADPVLAEKLIILHAPNHTTIKGSKFIKKAVDELAAEGVPVELDFVQKISNAELYKHIRRAHIIADQLIIGWYGMFAVEGMSAGKPVMSYIAPDLVQLYEFAGILEKGEIPVVNCDMDSFKDTLRNLACNRQLLRDLGMRSRAYVLKHHSLDSAARMFDAANRKMNILPRSGK